ncbi:MAG: hypothetical protein Q7T04_07160 [Dehalococcoidia bacterium]|nr:hypothetical protein [Dehalococcoidia bacterium]
MRKRIATAISLASLVGILALLALGQAGLTMAQTPATVRLVLSATQVNVGDAITGQIRIEGAPQLRGAEVHLTFEPGKLQVEDAVAATDGIQIQVGSLLEGFTPPGAGNSADNVTGAIGFARVSLPFPPDSFMMPDGVLAIVTFRAVATGTAPVNFTSVTLLKFLDNNISPILAQTVGGTVIIASASLPTTVPTPTATPAATPTQTPAPTPTPTPTPTPVPTAVPTLAPTPTPTATLQSLPAEPPAPTSTPAVLPPPTNPPTPPTVFAPFPTNTPVATPAPTLAPTSTPSPTATALGPLPTAGAIGPGSNWWPVLAVLAALMMVSAGTVLLLATERK